MKSNLNIQEITEIIESSSTDFEKANSEIKRLYFLWNIEVFNIIAKKVDAHMGTFGTGYPFYALDENFNGVLPIIQEQLIYNRKLVREGESIKELAWKCQNCLKEKYETMPDLKKICRPCRNIADCVKPRKIINRLPDIDMWFVCKDGHVEESQNQISVLLKQIGMRTSDENPLRTIDEFSKIVEEIKSGKMPSRYLPIDTHIIEYSELKKLILQVSEELNRAKEEKNVPYLPILPKSYRKDWQYDDEAYNFIYDYLSAFTPFDFEDELQKSLERSRKQVTKQFTEDELFDFLLASATPANFRRFQTLELEGIFKKKIHNWEKSQESDKDIIEL